MERNSEFNFIKSIVEDTFGTDFWIENETPARIENIESKETRYYKNYYHLKGLNDKLVMYVIYTKKYSGHDSFSVELNRYGNVGDHHAPIFYGNDAFKQAKIYISNLYLNM